MGSGCGNLYSWEGFGIEPYATRRARSSQRALAIVARRVLSFEGLLLVELVPLLVRHPGDPERAVIEKKSPSQRAAPSSA